MTQVLVRSVRRQKNRSSLMADEITEEQARTLATVTSYCLAVSMEAGHAIELVETTDRTVVERLRRILEEHLELKTA